MPDNKNPPENEEEKISRVGATIKCKNKDCRKLALSLSQYCWEHTDEKEQFQIKIEAWAAAMKSMKNFILKDADLSGLWLWGVNLSGAGLWEAKLSGAWLEESNLSGAAIRKANLSGAVLWEANLSGAWLRGAKLSRARLEEANLSGARLEEANLSGAQLGESDLSGAWLGESDLSGAGLEEANLSGAQLGESDLSGAWLGESDLSGAGLERANLSEAKLGGAKLIDARVNWAKLTGAIDLTKENFSEKLTYEEKKEAKKFKASYLNVKNYFIQNGLYDDASWAAFRERTLERIAWYKETKLEELKDLFSWNNWKTTFRWSRSMLMNLICGYGEKPWKAVASSVIIVIGFFLFYLFKECIKANPPEALRWWDYLYFSIVTFTTLGYGDIRPLPAPGARMVASGEAFIGAFMIALFVWTLARRYVAR